VIDLTREKLYAGSKTATYHWSEVADDSLVKEVQRDMKIKGR
jgi:hypothetical protein